MSREIPNSVLPLLKQYTELGLLTISTETVTVRHSPLFTAQQNRISALLKWLQEYCYIHNQTKTIDGSYFFTVLDGFREKTHPSLSGDYVKITDLDITKYNNEQFIHPTQLHEPYPIFPYPVISWSRHKGDSSVVLIPDQYYIIQNGYFQLLLQIKKADRPWTSKQNKVFWRGGKNGSHYSIYDPTCSKTQRELAMDISLRYPAQMDISFTGSVNKPEYLQYKYLLDVDGHVNAWDGLFWKLGSNSVVFKIESHWEEWYYDQLVPWIHYIPVLGDSSDLYEKYLWAEKNEIKVLKIIRNANELVHKYRYEYTLLSSKIFNNFKESNILVKKYYS